MDVAIISYMGLGVVVGLLSGMLGIGGGSVIVPALVFLFGAQHISQGLVMKLAVGTSLASILFTSMASIWAQHKRGAIDWSVAAILGAATLAGSLSSGYFAGFLPGALLQRVFAVFLGFVGLQLLASWQPAPHWRLPRRPILIAVGVAIGAASAVLGIGGGSFAVPFLTACNVDMRRAIAISASLGFPISLFGAIGFVLSGWHHSHLPEGSLGYVYLPALLGLTVVAIFVVPLGVHLSHRLPVTKLKRAFGGLLLAVSVQMIVVH